MKENQLLVNFATNFFGYGNLKAPYWFVGFEEGFLPGTPKRCLLPQAIVRARVWSCFGERCVLDIKEYHDKVANFHGIEDFNKWFCQDSLPPSQSTWR